MRSLRSSMWVAVMCLAQVVAAQSVPNLIRYSGTTAEGKAAETKGALFAIYAHREGGAALWQEVQNVAVDAQGRYSVALGSRSVGGVPAAIFASGEARWLGVSINGAAEGVRVQLASVPYAMKAKEADTVGGMSSEELVARSLQEFKRQYLAPTNTVSKQAPTAISGLIAAPSALVTTATNFTDATSNQVVLVTQNSTGAALKGMTASSTSNGIYGINTSLTGPVRGVYGEANSTSASSAGVYGISNAATGTTYGVLGVTNSAQGTALNGTATSTMGTAIGLRGQSNASSGTGVQGAETSATGVTVGINGFVLSPSGIAALFDNRAGGKILSLRNNSLEKFYVDGSGNLVTAGNLTGTIFTGNGSGLTNVNAATVGGFTAAQLGTVTSVGLTAPADFSVTGSPVTSAGALAFDWVTAPTASNTANAIVKRDASGNFTAGTATLTGATVNQAADGTTTIAGKRFTDSSPNGAFLNFTQTDGTTSLFSVDVSGNVKGATFTGSGAALSGVTAASVSAANIAAGTAGIDISGNAATATSATTATNAGHATSADSATTATTAGSASTAGSATTAGSAGSFTSSLIGDVTGGQSSTVVAAIRGTSVSAAVPTTGQMLMYTGSQWAPTSAPTIKAFTGTISTIAGSSTSFVFIGTTTTIVLSANQKLTGSASASLGLGSGGPAFLGAALCYKESASPIPSRFSAGFSYATVTTTVYPVSVSDSTGPLAAGTYTVGFCAYNPTAVAVNNNDQVVGWVMATY